MSDDDLIKRLRREQDYSDQKWHGNTYRIYTEAADRIEELEAANRPLPGTTWSVGFQFQGVSGQDVVVEIGKGWWTAGGADHAWDISKAERASADAEQAANGGQPIEWVILRRATFIERDPDAVRRALEGER